MPWPLLKCFSKHSNKQGAQAMDKCIQVVLPNLLKYGRLFLEIND